MELRSPHTDPYDEFTKTLDKVKAEGYTKEFTVMDEKLAKADQKDYKPDDLVINAIYRFKGHKDWFTSKQTAVKRREIYVLDAKDDVRGYLIADFDESGNEVIDQFLINVDRHDELHTNYN